MTMQILLLFIFGLIFGSFVNATVWRLYEQSKEADRAKPNKKYLKSLSITRGRSMCSHCHHVLASKDLVPVLSWLLLKGKCRYCGKPIPDSPLVEVSTAILFVVSYIWWPVALSSSQLIIFILWLLLLVGFMVLIVYDLRWLLLPNKVIYPLSAVALFQAVIIIANAPHPLSSIINTFWAIVIGGGFFYLLFQVSDGKWIGGGDVKLGWLLGLIVATPMRSLLLIFIASVGGSLVSLPLLWSGHLKRNSTIPFGPFLIISAIIVQLFGVAILSWYQHIILITN
jgi:prepilin signal peptidase PulO-like enzyme (type II secretory pathway)